MLTLETTVSRMIIYCILGVVVFFLLTGGYSVLRKLRISVDWVSWIIGTLLMAASVVLCLSILRPGYTGRSSGYSNLLGRASFFVAIYSVSQWTVRQWYVYIKKRTTSLIVKGSRNFLLFLRKHHIFFGWVVTLTAIGHMVAYLPVLAGIRQYEFITGFIALGILALSVLLGLWIWLQVTVRKQRTPRTVHTIHAFMAVAFFVTLLLHMASPAL